MIYIRDDNGQAWYFDRQRQRIICKGDHSPGGGYACYNLEEGIEFLNHNGYITGKKLKPRAETYITAPFPPPPDS